MHKSQSEISGKCKKGNDFFFMLGLFSPELKL